MISRIKLLELYKSIEGEIKDLMSLEVDFEFNQEYREKLISVKSKISLKMKYLQKGEGNVVSDLAAALGSKIANLSSITKHKIFVNLPNLNIEMFDGYLRTGKNFIVSLNQLFIAETKKVK